MIIPMQFASQGVRAYPRFGKQPNLHAKPQVKLETLLPQLEKISTTRTQTYRNQFQAVIDEAKAYLAPFNDGVVVKDLDETLLDNSAFDILYAAGLMNYHEWTMKGDATAIPEAKAFVDWLGQKGLKIYFVTARKERYRDITIKNLERIGIGPEKYEGIYFKPNTYKGTVNQFKVAAQKDIAKQGHPILAVIGDQESDVQGALGKGFKLPNAVYTSKA